MNITFPGESPEYRAARNHLLEEEINLRRAMESVAAARRNLPPGGPIPDDYVFDDLDYNGRPAKIKLSELFVPGKDTLIIYNLMFPRMPNDPRPGPTQGATGQLNRGDGPCPSCTALLDNLNGVAKHVEAAGFNFVVIAKAPLDRILAYAYERGWSNLRFLSAANNTFKRDYHAESPEGVQLPLITVFHRDSDLIRHFWTSEMLFAPPDPNQDPRHAGTIEQMWNIFDLTPEGRPANWHEQVDYDCCNHAMNRQANADLRLAT
jgi:predicted dithiol-disulfide oxidoreductase (DUF899 family)